MTEEKPLAPASMKDSITLLYFRSKKRVDLLEPDNIYITIISDGVLLSSFLGITGIPIDIDTGRAQKRIKIDISNL